MDSVKSETNCITTIGTVNSGTAMLRQFLALGLESLWEINVQFSEIPVTRVCFLLSDDNVICTLASFSSSLPESSKPQINIHKAFYRFRSPSFDRLLTDWAKPRPDDGVLLCESSVQVAKHSCEGNETLIVYLHQCCTAVLKVRNTTNRI